MRGTQLLSWPSPLLSCRHRSRLRSQTMCNRSLSESSCFYRPQCSYQLKTGVFGESMLISLGDYIDPRPLITHLLGWSAMNIETVTKFCMRPFLLNQPHLSPPLLSVVWKLGSNCCCSFSKWDRACLHYKSGQWDSFRFCLFLFFQLVCSKYFLHFRDNAVVRERRRLLLRYPPFNNAPFFMFILRLSQQLLRSWASGAPPCTAQGLRFDTPVL